MKVFSPLLMNLREIRDVLAHIIAGNPGSPVEGQHWYNSVTKRWGYRTNTTNMFPFVDAADIPDGTIANGKLTTNPLARANHTGTQTASTISDFDTQVRTNRLDQMAAPTASVSLNSQRITSLADGTGANDAVNLSQLQTAIAGLSWKDSVRVASTANVVIASALENGDAIDGITLATGDRVLLKDQSSALENGIYVVVASGAAARSTDADTALELEGAAVMVEEGTANANTQWVQTSDNFTLGVGSVVWVQFGGSTTYTAGDGLTLTANDFDVGAGTGISVGADTVSIDTAVVVRKFLGTVEGDNSTTTFSLTHNLATAYPGVTVWDDDATPKEIVLVDARRNTDNITDIVFSTAPGTGATYKVAIFG